VTASRAIIRYNNDDDDDDDDNNNNNNVNTVERKHIQAEICILCGAMYTAMLKECVLCSIKCFIDAYILLLLL
jgi:hypothetical protein